MNFLNSDHIRVVTPLTIDGVTPKLDEKGMQMYKETFLPLTAKKFIEAQNIDLPNHLKKIIEVISDLVPQPGAQPVTTTNQQLRQGGAKRFYSLGRSHLTTFVKTSTVK